MSPGVRSASRNATSGSADGVAIYLDATAPPLRVRLWPGPLVPSRNGPTMTSHPALPTGASQAHSQRSAAAPVPTRSTTGSLEGSSSEQPEPRRSTPASRGSQPPFDTGESRAPQRCARPGTHQAERACARLPASTHSLSLRPVGIGTGEVPSEAAVDHPTGREPPLTQVLAPASPRRRGCRLVRLRSVARQPRPRALPAATAVEPVGPSLLGCATIASTWVLSLP